MRRWAMVSLLATAGACGDDAIPGTLVATCAPDCLFESAVVGTYPVVTVEVEAVGGPVEIQRVSVDGTGGPGFRSIAAHLAAGGRLPVGVVDPLEVGPLWLGEGEAVALPIVVGTDAEGFAQGTVLVVTGARHPVEIPVRARVEPALAFAWPAQLDFGTVAPGERELEVFALENHGDVALELVARVVPDASPFDVEGSRTIRVEPKGSRAVGVAFTPDDEDWASARLVFTIAEDVVASVHLVGNDT